MVTDLPLDLELFSVELKAEGKWCSHIYAMSYREALHSVDRLKDMGFECRIIEHPTAAAWWRSEHGEKGAE